VFRCTVVGSKFAANVGLVAILGCKLEIIDGGTKMLGLMVRWRCTGAKGSYQHTTNNGVGKAMIGCCTYLRCAVHMMLDCATERCGRSFRRPKGQGLWVCSICGVTTPKRVPSGARNRGNVQHGKHATRTPAGQRTFHEKLVFLYEGNEADLDKVSKI